VLAQPGINSTPIGASQPSLLKANVAAMNFKLDDNPWQCPTPPGGHYPADSSLKTADKESFTDRDHFQGDALIQGPFFPRGEGARSAAAANTTVRIEFIKPMNLPPRDASWTAFQ